MAGGWFEVRMISSVNLIGHLFYVFWEKLFGKYKEAGRPGVETPGDKMEGLRPDFRDKKCGL
jgi:hypothetical protein